ncbi:MAG: hypothetical protein AB1421_15665 [Pseudomonadota bacterium]
MSLLSSDAALLLPGRALLRSGGKPLAARQGEGWEGALVSLEAVLAQAGKPGRLRVYLSHHFASLHLLPPPSVRLSAEEMAGWLQEHLVRDYGTEADAWRLAWQDAAPGRPVPVTAMPQAQYDALHACLADAGARLALLAPWFLPAWARHGRAAAPAGGKGWLVLAEPGRLALACMERGRLHHLSLARLDDSAPAPDQIGAAVARQALLLGMESPARIAVLAPDQTLEAGRPGAALAIHPLAGGIGWEGVLP